MYKFQLPLIVLFALMLGACAQSGGNNGGAAQTNWWKNLRGGAATDTNQKNNAALMKARQSGYELLPMPEIMSNENVIVYSLEGDINLERVTFPGSNADNDGGYTVFDSSVEVFPVDGGGGMPSYMPNYDVPTYGSGPLNVSRRANPGLTSPSMIEPVSEPQVITQRPLAPIDRSPRQNAGRRSRPVLTAYE